MKIAKIANYDTLALITMSHIDMETDVRHIIDNIIASFYEVKKLLAHLMEFLTSR